MYKWTYATQSGFQIIGKKIYELHSIHLQMVKLSVKYA